jgi:hypothetical protein
MNPMKNTSIRIAIIAMISLVTIVTSSLMAEEVVSVDHATLGQKTETLQLIDSPILPSTGTYFKLSLWTPVELPWTRHDITGLRINLLYAKHQNVTGLDLGLGINRSTHFKGLQIALANIQETTTGVGLGLLNYADHATGFYVGVVNIFKESSSTSIGIIYNENLGRSDYPQIGMITYSGDVRCLQFGLINLAKVSNGLQVGLVNHADIKESGMQIGLLNFVQGKVPLPILRW